jgi:hypothetical protein
MDSRESSLFGTNGGSQATVVAVGSSRCTGYGVTPNPSLERTSTGWARYARCLFSASRAQPVPAAQLKR